MLPRLLGAALVVSLCAAQPAKADGGVIAAAVVGVVGAVIYHKSDNRFRHFPAASYRHHCHAGHTGCQRLCEYNPQGEYFCYFR
jgi:hypothetical protein